MSASADFQSSRVKPILIQAVIVFTWLLLLVRVMNITPVASSPFFDLTILILSVIGEFFFIQSIRAEADHRQKLMQLTKQIQDTTSKKDEFINMAAHELRAPLTAIKGFLSMVIGGDAGKISPEAKGFLDDSAVSTERMIRLVNNMLNVTRIEEGRMFYQNEDVHIGDTAHGVYTEFQVEAERKALVFKLEKAPEVKDLVFADEDKLHEIIVNFVSNAIKYTEKGAVVISVTNPQPSRVRLSVIDSGSGISKEEQQKLFQKFYRVEAKVGKTIGTGLGLYISKLLIEKFGGDIGVISNEGKGSTFWIELPVKG